MTATIDFPGQTLGELARGWKAPPPPAREVLRGRTCRLEPLDPKAHGPPLFEADARDREGRSWTYLPYGPFATLPDYRAWMEKTCSGLDPLFFAIVTPNGPVGVASYQRIDAANGSIEVGHVHYSPALQRSVAATEAMHLMMSHAFGLGYRRYEWKCDALNTPSREAARRLGFSFEGIFRQALIVKGRNRDTAWHSVLDKEWPTLRDAFRQWLDPANFDDEGSQRVRLSDLTRPIIKQPYPAP